MNNIKTSVLYYDLIERMDTALEKGQVSPDLERKVKARGRIFYAINEAVKYFVTRANVPLNALSGFIPTKLYHLQKSDVVDYDGLAVYAWPEAANKSRADGGLLRLNLDGRAFEPILTNDPILLSNRLTSLQYQAGNELMYGTKHQNAVVDLMGTQIFVPADVEPKAQIVINPDIVSIEGSARGKGVLTVTADATTAGDITIANDNPAIVVTVGVLDTDTKFEVAAKITNAINADADIKIRAVLFADEVWFYTTDKGTSAMAELTMTEGTTGVTFDSATLNLKPEETAELPIDETHQELIAIGAFNHMINNVVFVGDDSEGDGEE